MAKQVGLFGLRGKIENKSFYKTAGVLETVIRGIPEGLSNRVKTADEYANTRLNNAEFKNANAIATAAFKSVNTRYRGMMRRFAIAAMTKAALEDIKQGAQAWGVRMPVTELDVLIANMLENHAKNGAYDGKYGVFSNHIISSNMDSWMQSDGSYSVYVTLSVEKQQELLNMGINRLQFITSKCLAGEKVVDGVPRLFAGNSISPLAPVTIPSTPTEDLEIILSGTCGTPSSVGMSPSGYEFAQEDAKHGFYLCVSILPMRGANVLQEYCTFNTLPLGQIPED